MEAEAILLILKRFELGEWQWISSETMDFEIEQTPSVERKNSIYLFFDGINLIFPPFCWIQI
ncbi:hypothetical protein PN36_28175 [Candidatus Thiomargarita nelsonii]|uniref:Uncharacterized protein n=1 Tax=Candidatus Thiomargarita nelsonii TaxID=1003181 RepID=A0A0A6RZG4_9GAMM|nr:hypothetical protein PN36_28175 [Candidatus Thiomargarita nelsonii]